MTDYDIFLEKKRLRELSSGFKPIWIPKKAFDFQAHLIDYAIRTGRCGMFESCGLGKSLQELVVAQNCLEHTNKAVLFFTPLTVQLQMKREGEKFGIDTYICRDGKPKAKQINITNYQQIHRFNPNDFGAVVCDESSIIKSMDGDIRKQLTEFSRNIPYRFLFTATPAPNDYTEFGTSSEALGYMRHTAMLSTFFQRGENNHEMNLKGHARVRFWEWVASWSRIIRSPSDIGFSDKGFDLPPLIVNENLVAAETKQSKKGFGLLSALSLQDQRSESRQSLLNRCEKVLELLPKDKPGLIWCNLNSEGDLLEKIIPNSVQVSGNDSDEEKEEKIWAFVKGEVGAQRMITKGSVCGFGLNFQHCAYMTYFVDHSWEKFHQLVRRCWRFGQKDKVVVDMVLTQGLKRVLQNLRRKEQQADTMFREIAKQMSKFQKEEQIQETGENMLLPNWL